MNEIKYGKIEFDEKRLKRFTIQMGAILLFAFFAMVFCVGIVYYIGYTGWYLCLLLVFQLICCISSLFVLRKAFIRNNDFIIERIDDELRIIKKDENNTIIKISDIKMVRINKNLINKAIVIFDNENLNGRLLGNFYSNEEAEKNIHILFTNDEIKELLKK